MPRAYIIINVTVTHPEQMALYREWSSKAMQEHNADILVRGGTVEVLEGDWQPDRVVVLGFESMDKARAFYHSETYTYARRLRENAGIMRMVLVEGV